MNKQAIILWTLYVAFLARVIGQILVANGIATTILPPFEAWQSGVVAYSVLLALQAAVLLIFGKACLDTTHQAGFFAQLTPRARKALRTTAAAYFLFFASRYLLVHLWMTNHLQWAPEIPTVFHFVLATFLFVLGQERTQPNRIIRNDSIDSHIDGAGPFGWCVHSPDVYG